jgi:hypothetical protein
LTATHGVASGIPIIGGCMALRHTIILLKCLDFQFNSSIGLDNLGTSPARLGVSLRRLEEIWPLQAPSLADALVFGKPSDFNSLLSRDFFRPSQLWYTLPTECDFCEEELQA